jgi:hypothetical protein
LSALFIITCGNKLGLWIYGLSRRRDRPSSDINTDTDDTDTDTNITNHRLDTQPLDPRHQRGDGGDGNNNTNNVILSDMEQQNSISTRKAILFPVVGAVILMLLFFFLDILIWLFIVLVSISAFFSISFLAYAPLQALLETRLAFKVLPVRWIPRAIPYVSSHFYACVAKLIPLINVPPRPSSSLPRAIAAWCYNGGVDTSGRSTNSSVNDVSRGNDTTSSSSPSSLVDATNDHDGNGGDDGSDTPVPLDDVEIATGVGVSSPSPVVEVPLGIFLGCIVSIVILIVWYTTNHWIVVNFIGFCMAITALSSLRCVVAFAYMGFLIRLT